MNEKKNYDKPKMKIAEITYESMIASSYLEEGIGDGGGPRAKYRYGLRDKDDDFFWIDE